MAFNDHYEAGTVVYHKSLPVGRGVVIESGYSCVVRWQSGDVVRHKEPELRRWIRPIHSFVPITVAGKACVTVLISVAMVCGTVLRLHGLL